GGSEPRLLEDLSVQVGDRRRAVEGQRDQRSSRTAQKRAGLPERVQDPKLARAGVVVERLEHLGFEQVGDHLADDVAEARPRARRHRRAQLRQALEVIALVDRTNEVARLAGVEARDQTLEHLPIAAAVGEPQRGDRAASGLVLAAARGSTKGGRALQEMAPRHAARARGLHEGLVGMARPLSRSKYRSVPGSSASCTVLPTSGASKPLTRARRWWPASSSSSKVSAPCGSRASTTAGADAMAVAPPSASTRTCSGRTPSVSAPADAGAGTRSGPTVARFPSRSASSRFIGGEPKRRATKVVAGCS